MLALYNEMAFYPSAAGRKGNVPQSNLDEPQDGAVPAGTCFSDSTSSSSLDSKKGPDTLCLSVECLSVCLFYY